MQSTDVGLAQAMADALDSEDMSSACLVIVSGFERLASRAREAGVLRSDVSFTDVVLLLKANAG